MNKIAAIESALCCFVSGLLALLPILGMGFTVVAFMYYRKCSILSRQGWNPAQRYALLGLIFALIGPAISLGAWWMILYRFKDELRGWW